MGERREASEGNRYDRLHRTNHRFNLWHGWAKANGHGRSFCYALPRVTH